MAETPKPKKRAWLIQDIAELKSLALSGMTAEQCAERMGREISAIQAFAKTIRLGFGRKTKRSVSVFPVIKVDGAFDGIGAISLAHALHTHCRWPMNGKDDQGRPTCCGGQIYGNKPYCKKHAERVYTVSPAKQAQDPAPSVEMVSVLISV